MVDKILSEKELKEDLILKKQGNIFILILNRKINTFTTQFVRQINEKLDEVEQSGDNSCALITISSSEKFFSTGLDFKHLSSLSAPAEVQNFLLEMTRLLGRMSVFPVPTIAAVTGHAYAGGCMFALAHDYRIMGQGKGLWAMTESELGMPLPPGMASVCKNKLSKNVNRDLILYGKKYNGEEALKLQIIDKLVPQSELLNESLKLAQSLETFGANKQNMGVIKEEMYKDIVNNCFNVGLSTGVPFKWTPTVPKAKL